MVKIGLGIEEDTEQDSELVSEELVSEELGSEELVSEELVSEEVNNTTSCCSSENCSENVEQMEQVD